jgi:hypothetical protein
MAQMIPPDPPPRQQGTVAEHELYEALRHGLSDDYFVYYGLGIYLLRKEDAAVQSTFTQ